MNWHPRQAMTGAAGLLAISALLGCEDDPANQLAGELGEGTFTYLCLEDSDAQCDLGEETSDLALANIALAGRFGINYSDESIDYLQPATMDRLDYDDTDEVWVAAQTGWVGVIAIDNTMADDFAHFRVVEPTGLRISQREASGQFTGSFGGVSITVSAQSPITLRVAPVDDQDAVLAGALSCSWTSSDPATARVAGDATDNVILVEPLQNGSATLSVQLGELTAQTTIEVGG